MECLPLCTKERLYRINQLFVSRNPYDTDYRRRKLGEQGVVVERIWGPHCMTFSYIKHADPANEYYTGTF